MIANEVSRVANTRLWMIKLRTGLIGTAVIAVLLIVGVALPMALATLPAACTARAMVK